MPHTDLSTLTVEALYAETPKSIHEEHTDLLAELPTPQLMGLASDQLARTSALLDFVSDVYLTDTDPSRPRFRQIAAELLEFAGQSAHYADVARIDLDTIEREHRTNH